MLPFFYRLSLQFHRVVEGSKCSIISLLGAAAILLLYVWITSNTLWRYLSIFLLAHVGVAFKKKISWYRISQYQYFIRVICFFVSVHFPSIYPKVLTDLYKLCSVVCTHANWYSGLTFLCKYLSSLINWLICPVSHRVKKSHEFALWQNFVWIGAVFFPGVYHLRKN